MTEREAGADARPRVKVLGREFGLPRSRLARIVVGVLLMAGGVVGFLPILGFWMLPLGLLVLSYDFAVARRWRRRLAVWWERRKAARAGQARGRGNGKA
ncbi:MAG: hypothetical protein K5872_22975 [Rhizobiaceae bacterium]|nr:hypothetical protein [Rhizobiaceae bacterium]MCV0409084.1 hypothetical protein [Rhizobiaceae bacterium]